MKTAFYELAEKIGNKELPWWYISWHQNLEFDKIIHFISWFEHLTDFENDDHRITALLFADLLWQDEMKGKKK